MPDGACTALRLLQACPLCQCQQVTTNLVTTGHAAVIGKWK